jgi:hypothetical protein
MLGNRLDLSVVDSAKRWIRYSWSKAGVCEWTWVVHPVVALRGWRPMVLLDNIYSLERE